ncbi:hypothetical protein A6A06_05455 [Streptomyces sp. CB02923]|uniref:DUF2243 domain-containing protein n=1 Tax=Streptomyces sp. CB02923 TaxID=1718985 RepID=UPI00093DB769|nr:DUF2243 domain-containing protein [Streptomyces sp. CB02923]OKI10056.1 hypothetical protein A6A06_05455 [Streptomyces sp. CB02923]
MRRSRTVVGGVLTGIGTAAFVDETVFHQLLHWHHFYDLSTTDAGLVSDGLFHAGSWLAMVAGLVLYADVRRRGALVPAAWWGGLCLGLGGFQLYDGTFQHKVLGIHQIRYGVDLAPYDWTWGGIAVLFLLAGALLLVRARRTAPRAASSRTASPTASRSR